MDEKQSRWDKLFKFVGDKGFYIVLFLCVAVIGVSAWVISGSIGGLEEARNTTLSAALPPVSAGSTQSAAQGADGQTTPPRITLQPPKVTVPVPEEEPVPPAQKQEPAAPTVQPQEETKPAESVLGEAIPAPEEPPVQSVMAQPEPESRAPESFLWPVTGPVETPHSLDALVYSRTMADWRTHTGLDIGANLGARVLAAADGTVERVYRDVMYGTTVVIRHGGGLSSVYANLADAPAVAEGETVELGRVIGSVGETALAEIGDVTHLHFAMTLDGAPVDPRNYLPGG